MFACLGHGVLKIVTQGEMYNMSAEQLCGMVYLITEIKKKRQGTFCSVESSSAGSYNQYNL